MYLIKNIKYDSRCSRIVCTTAKTQKRLRFDINKHDFLDSYKTCNFVQSI